jgi:hypothetical protein
MDSDNASTPDGTNPPDPIATQPQRKERSTLKLILGAVAIIIVVGILRLATSAISSGALNNACTTLPNNSNSTLIVLAYPNIQFLSNGGGLSTDYSSVEVHTNNGWFCTDDTGGTYSGSVDFLSSSMAQVIAVAHVRNIDINEIKLEITPAPGGLVYNGKQSLVAAANSTITANVSSSGSIPPNHIVILFVDPTLNTSGSIPVLNFGSPAAFVDKNIPISFSVLQGQGIEVGSQAFLNSTQLAEINASISK